MAAEYVAEVSCEHSAISTSPRPLLIARAAVARDILPAELRRRGAVVDVVEAYRTGAPTDLPLRAANVLAAKTDWIAFTSSSTASNLIAACGVAALHGIRVASIGPSPAPPCARRHRDRTRSLTPHRLWLVEAIRATRPTATNLIATSAIHAWN